VKKAVHFYKRRNERKGKGVIAVVIIIILATYDNHYILPVGLAEERMKKGCPVRVRVRFLYCESSSLNIQEHFSLKFYRNDL